MPDKPQGREADQQCKRAADQRGNQQHERPGQVFGKHRDRVAADAEEAHGRKRDVARRAREQSPRGRKHGVQKQVDEQRDHIAVGKPRRERQGYEHTRRARQDGELHVPWSAGHAGRPNSPAGRINNTAMKSA